MNVLLKMRMMTVQCHPGVPALAIRAWNLVQVSEEYIQRHSSSYTADTSIQNLQKLRTSSSLVRAIVLEIRFT